MSRMKNGILNNKVYVAGVVKENPKLSHELKNEKFYSFHLEVPRLSGQVDLVPLTVSEQLLQQNKEIKVGAHIACNGQLRSYNKKIKNSIKLIITVFVREFVAYDESKNTNELELVGFLCKEPNYRTTPLKREICDLLLAVNRHYNKSDYLPCITWGAVANDVKEWNVGDKVKLVGRIQSRTYNKRVGENETVERIAYEVSVSEIEQTEQDEQNEEE